MSDFISDPSVGIYYSKKSEVMFTASPDAPRNAVGEDDGVGDDSVIASWGANNDFPKKVDDALELNADLASGLDWQARAMYAGGLSYEITDMATGEVTKKKSFEIEKFLFRNQGYLMQAAKDFYKYINVFPEFKMDNGGKKVAWLIARPAGHCRLGKQKKDGTVDQCYINADFNEGAEVSSAKTLKRTLLDPFRFMPEDLLKLENRNQSFIYPLSYPSGKSTYQLASWNGIRVNGWLDLANEIAKFKMALMKNQMTVKFHIEMPDYWMPWKYDDWKKMTPSKKKELIGKEMKKFDDFLTKSENAGKSITTIYKTDGHTGKGWDGWRITPIDDKLKDGAYLEDSVEATIKIFSAIGLDPALFGIVPGKGGSNRSGSDKREALNIYISMIQSHIDIILRPYQFISWVNGWNNEKEMIRWFFKAPMLQTLDQISPSKRETKIEDDAA